MYEYLDYKRRNGQRFVIRAKVDRQVLGRDENLFETVARDALELSSYAVYVVQRGGRKARQAQGCLRSVRLELHAPQGGAPRAPLTVNAILAEERDAPPDVDPLRWVLLTTEPVSSAEEARQVVRYYELRWRMEDYHKAWKSGVGVERQRFRGVGADGKEITAVLSQIVTQIMAL